MFKIKWIKKIFPVSLCGLFLFSGCFPKKEGSVIARFDGVTITDVEFTQRFERLPKELQGVVSRKKQGLVDELINEHFLVKEAERQNIANQPEVRDLLNEARNKIIIAKLIELEVDNRVKLEPDEALKYYEAHKDEFMTPLLLRASHILVKTEQEADNIRMQLGQGADFEELARGKSVDSSSVRGGDIGFFQKGQLIPEFERAAFSVKKGEVSHVFKTQFGYHVLKLTDRAEPAFRDFKVVKGLVERQLLNQKRAKLFNELVEKLKNGSPIKIDEKKLNAITPLSSSK